MPKTDNLQQMLKDVATVGPIDMSDALGPLLGVTSDGEAVCLRVDENAKTNQHIAVIGGERQERASSFGVPYIVQAARRGDSIIINDPDGSYYRLLGDCLRQNGYMVRYFCFGDPDKSDRMDCLFGVHDIFDAYKAADALALNMGFSEEELEPAKSLLRTVIIRVALRKNESDKTLRAVLKTLRTVETGKRFEAQKEYLQQSPASKKTMAAFSALPNKARTKIAGQIISRLERALLDEIMDIVACLGPSVDLRLPAKRRCAFFCSYTRSDKKALRSVLSLYYAMLMGALSQFSNSCPGGRCPLTVDFLLDGFCSVGTLPSMARTIAVSKRGRLNFALCCDCEAQMKRTYPNSWLGILSHCGTRLTYTNDGVFVRFGELPAVELDRLQEEKYRTPERLFL